MANTNYQKGQFLVVPNKNIVLKLRGAALNVYLAVVDHADDNGRCFPSYNRIADVTGYNKRQCIRAINELEEMGLLEKTTRKLPVRGNTSNIYQLKVIHSPSVTQDTGGSVTQDTPTSVLEVTPKLNPLNSNHNNSRELDERTYKRNYYKSSEQDRALEKRQARRGQPDKGSFGSISDILGNRNL